MKDWFGTLQGKPEFTWVLDRYFSLCIHKIIVSSIFCYSESTNNSENATNSKPNVLELIFSDWLWIKFLLGLGRILFWQDTGYPVFDI